MLFNIKRAQAKKYQCPCCEYYTIEKKHDICEVCSWQYDEVAHDKPDTMRGANSVTLNEARENYKKFGASDEASKQNVRPPRECEKTGISSEAPW